MMADKSELRKRFISLRAELNSPERDGAILDNFLSSPFFRNQSFFVYHSVKSEVDTLRIINMLLTSDKQVFLPRVQKGEMLAVPYTEERELLFGIPQPREGSDHKVEIILTPLLAFDGKGFRLGYGGGFYDKYFASHGGLRVGLAYEGQAVKSLPRDSFDERLDAVITEKGVRYFN